MAEIELGTYKPQYKDSRGVFIEAYGKAGSLFPVTNGVIDPYQINVVCSHKNAFRGLHLHKSGKQTKEIICISGNVEYFAVNCIKDSQVYGRSYNVSLRPFSSFFVPGGYASGFLALEDSIVMYQTNVLYDAEQEVCLSLDDSVANLDFGGYDRKQFILSEKDQHGSTLDEVKISLC